MKFVETSRQWKRGKLSSISNNQRVKLSQFRLHYFYVSFRTRRHLYFVSVHRKGKAFIGWKQSCLNLCVRCQKKCPYKFMIIIFFSSPQLVRRRNNKTCRCMAWLWTVWSERMGRCIKMMRNIFMSLVV